MFRPAWKKSVMLAGWMVAGVMLLAGSAQAGWGHWHGGWYGYGYYPAYAYTTSYCSPCVARCGWSYCNPCWSGCYSGCCSACYTPWYGSYDVVSDCCDSVVIESKAEADAAPTPAPPAAEEPEVAAPVQEPASVLPNRGQPKVVPPAPDVDLPTLPDMPALPPAAGDAPKPTAGRRLPPDAARLTVVVPQDAQVYVNGMLTKTVGTQRQFVSHGMKPGRSYTYEVRALVTRDGETLSDVQVVRVRVGEARKLAFDFAARPDAVIAARLP